MSERILFVSPAKLYPVDKDGRPMQQVRQNVCLPALTVLGSLKSEGFEVDFMDLAADGYGNQTPYSQHTYRFGLPDEAVVERISSTKPFALLVTSMFSTEQQMVDDLTAKVKKAFPKLPIIAGGIHATLKPEWSAESGNIDIIVSGEGEETVPELLKTLKMAGGLELLEKKRGRGPHLIEGFHYKMSYKDDSLAIRATLRPKIEDLNRPWALDEVLLKDGKYRYNDNHSRRSRIYTHMTSPEWTRSFSLYYSRGCPTHCEYCSTSGRDGRKVRHMGHERMFNDFKLLHERYGVNIFYNQADTFGLNPEDIEFLRKVREYRKEHSDFVMNNPNAFFARIFFQASKNYELDEGLIGLFADAGFNVMTIAAETFNQRFNKKIDFNNMPPEKMKELFAAIHKKGMKTELYMIYAFPGQTEEELLNDERIVSSFSDVDEVAWQNCMVLPGTGYYKKVVGEGLLAEQTYRHALKKGYFFHHMPEIFNFSSIPISELEEFRRHHTPTF